MKSPERLIHRRGLHVMFLLPGLLALMMLGLGGVIFQIATTMADSYSPDSPAAWALEHLALVSLVASIGMTLLGTMLGVFLSRALVRSMRDVIRTAQSSLIGSPPADPPARKRTEAFVEVEQIGQTFNQMMRDIYLSFRQRDSALLQGAATGLVTLDMQGNIMAANSRAEEYTGLKSGDMVGRTFASLGNLNPELASIEKLTNDVIGRQKLAAEGNAEFSSRDGRKRRLLLSASLIQDHGNRPSGCILMIRPSQRYGETDKRMREIDRLAMLGTFTVGLVHEIRNPIAAIKGLSTLLGQMPSDSPKAREFATEIQNEAARLERLLGELHQLANKSPEGLRSPCNINQVLSTSLSSVRHAVAKSDVQVDEQYTSGLPNVMGFSDRLIQAFSNIIKNAFDAINPGGEITIKTRRLVSVDEARNLIQIMITNTGSTISDADRGKIFEPFYTTKSGGTGLGLPIATQVIVQHDGVITLHTAENFTTFEIILPAMKEDPENGQGPIAAPDNSSANARHSMN